MKAQNYFCSRAQGSYATVIMVAILQGGPRSTDPQDPNNSRFFPSLFFQTT